jgi:hypothetical protein
MHNSKRKSKPTTQIPPKRMKKLGTKGLLLFALLQWRTRVIFELLALLKEEGSLLMDH